MESTDFHQDKIAN